MSKKLFYIFILALLFRFIISFLGWHPDLTNHIDWGIRFWEYGPYKFYTANVWSFTWPNQPPGSMYIFAAIYKLYEFIFSIFWFLNIYIPAFPSNIMYYLELNLYQALLKLPAILADLGIAVIIYNFLKKNSKTAFIAASVFLFNPVIWYNSSYWGQSDATINFLSLLGFYFLLKKRIILATIAVALSIYIKASLLIFLPIFLIVLIKQRYKITEIVLALFISFTLIGILTLPFSQKEPFSWLLQIYQDKVFKEQLHLITANAFNVWAFIATIHAQSDNLFLGPFTYQIWGYIFFALFYIPALYIVYKKQGTENILFALALSSFASFMLLTNMHERYLYPLYPVLTILAFIHNKLLPLYIIVSLIGFTNLYNFWWNPEIIPIINLLSWNDRILTRLLGLINFILFGWFFYFIFVKLKLHK